MSGQSISLTVNGKSVTHPTEPRTHLADFLREDLLLTGTHLGRRPSDALLHHARGIVPGSRYSHH